MRYYYCTNCGHFYDFGKKRKRNVKCLDCGYKDILELDHNEYIEEKTNKPWRESFMYRTSFIRLSVETVAELERILD